MTIQFTYINDRDENKLRRNEPIAASNTHIQGKENGEVKTFRLDRIADDVVIEISTGEIIKILDLCTTLPELVLPTHKATTNCINFTGFPAKRKEELAQMVAENKTHFTVVQDVTKELTYLVYNVNRAKPSENKIAKAKQIGAKVLTEEEFLQWLKS